MSYQVAADPRSHASAAPPPPVPSHLCPVHFPRPQHQLPHRHPEPPANCCCQQAPIHNPNPNPAPWYEAPPPHSAIAFDPYLHGGYPGQYASSYQPPPPPAPGAPYYGTAATLYGEYPNPHGQELVQPALPTPGASYYQATPGLGEYANPQPITNVGRRATTEDLNTKKRKVIAGGAQAGSIRICTICNVVCNSDKVFTSHLAGEKHALKALGRSSTGTVQAVSRLKSFYCDVCNIDCNSPDALGKHKQGKKHLTNLLKLQASITMPAVVTVAGNASQEAEGEQPRKRAKEDLEGKKRNVLENGTAAYEVKECTLCNVVCNSQTVFIAHMTGRKHVAMMKQQLALTS